MSVEGKLRVIAPQFDGDPDFEDALAIASDQMSATVWGVRYESGLAYLIAHILTLRDRNDPEKTGLGSGGAGVGGVTSIKTGGLSIGFGAAAVLAAGKKSDAIYATTDFGLAWLALRQQNTTTPHFAGGLGKVSR